MHKERGITDWGMLLIGLILIVVVVGFLKNDPSQVTSFNIKKFLRLPCGISVRYPEKDEKILFPVQVQGFMNECGWNLGADGTLGTVQVFDTTGAPVTKPTPIMIADGGTSAPYYFETLLTVYQPPRTDTGRIVFTSPSGLLSIVPVQF